MRRHALVSSVVVLVGLGLACGGGGGSGSGSGATADITADNAVAIASDVMRGILLSADLSTIGGAIFSGDVLPSAAGDAADEAPLRALAGGLRIAGSVEAEPLPSLPGGISPSAAFDPFTEPCDAGGTVTLSGNIAGSQPTAGDRINASYDNCINRDDANQPLPPLNGGLSFTIQNLSGNTEALFAMLLALSFDELTSGVDAAPDRLATDGSASTSYNNTAPPKIVSAAEGTNLRFERGPEASSTTLTLRSFEAQLTQDTEDDTYEIEGDGQTSISAGVVDYDVTETLEGDEGQTGETLEHPGDGVVLVEGAASAMQIVVLDETNVDLKLDLDDDGVFEQTLPKTWTDLGF